MSAPIYPVPDRRVDGLVTDPFTGASRWRTDYAGVVWYGGPPPTAPRSIVVARMAALETGFFLPDGHAYRRDGIADADLQISVALFRTSGEASYLLDAVASFVDDPRDASVAFPWIVIRGTARVPLAVSYRVVVQAATDAVLRPPG